MAETIYCLAVYRQSLPTSELVHRADVGRISGHSSSPRGFSLFHGCVTLARTRAHVRTGLVFLVHLWSPKPRMVPTGKRHATDDQRQRGGMDSASL